MSQTLPSHLQSVEILQNEQVAKNLWRMIFKAPKLAQELLPGQFFTIAVTDEPRQLTKIPLSYATADKNNGTVETLYAVVGPGTEALTRMVRGECTDVVGPCGHGWRIEACKKRTLLVTGGCGVPSVLSAARALSEEHIPFDCILAARTADHLYGQEVLNALGCSDLVLATDDGSAGEQGNAAEITEHLLKRVGSDYYDAILTCGPPKMMEAMAHVAQEHDLPCQVSLERRMTCGFGACATCAVRTVDGMKEACIAGPVFDAREVVW